VSSRSVGEIDCGSDVLGDDVDETLVEGGLHQFAGPEIELTPHRDAGSFERLCVELGDQGALREVERRDHDGVVGPARGRRGWRAGRARTRHEHDHRQQDPPHRDMIVR
jgi:hypothetical protein